ncbi:MAG: hypothetical protein ACE5JR_12340 [Gemmatimonadota bacterium]
MRALTVVNPPRLQVLGPALDVLVQRGFIAGWTAFSITERDSYAGLPEHCRPYLTRVRFPREDHRLRSRAEADRCLRDLALRYPRLDFGRVLATEKYIAKYFPDGLIDIANLFMNLEEAITGDPEMGVLLGDLPASLLDMAAYQICKSCGMATVFLMTSRFSEPRLVIFNQPEVGYSAVLESARSRLAWGPLPAELEERARRYVRAVAAGNAKPPYVESMAAKQRGAGVVRKLARGSRLLLRPGEFVQLLRASWENFALRRDWNSIFSRLDEVDEFVFFPVQYEPEASTYLMTPFWKDQYHALEALCYSVPPGYTVYVKEHPLHLRQRRICASTLRDYLGKLPNLRFADPREDSHRIIRRSRAVVVLSSTAGWEALLCGKPVFQLGHCEYSRFGGVYPVESFDELSRIMADAIAHHEVSEEPIVRTVATMYEGTAPGLLDDPKWAAKVTARENIENVARAFELGYDADVGPAA